MAEGTEFSESTGAPGVDPVVLGYERRLGQKQTLNVK
jgi:hypothetical protein